MVRQSKAPAITRAEPDDAEGIRALFTVAYGKDYPLTLGNDLDAMRAVMADPANCWVVAREPKTGRVVGTTSMKADHQTQIGKAGGTVVAPDYRGGGLANAMVNAVCEDALGADGWLNSIYATVRLNSPGPQRACLNSGFGAYGIIPNSVKVARHEPSGLMVRYRQGVLEQRLLASEAPEQVKPLLELVTYQSGVDFGPVRYMPVAARPSWEIPLTTLVEGEEATRWFLERVPAIRRIYPFQTPNLVLGPEGGDFEVYMKMEYTLGCATMVGMEPFIAEVGVPGLFTAVANTALAAGCPHLEVLIRLNNHEAVRGLVAAGFFPVVVYPAAIVRNGVAEDIMLMCRTRGAIQLQNLRVEPFLKPYINYLETLPQPYQRTAH
jgi:RimJ/RimL family protein N-acetyltransferase